MSDHSLATARTDRAPAVPPPLSVAPAPEGPRSASPVVDATARARAEAVRAAAAIDAAKGLRLARDILAGRVFVPAQGADVPASASADAPLRDLLLLSVELGILEGFDARAVEFLRTHARPWFGTGIERAADDPHTLRAYGRFAAERVAQRALWSEAIDAVEHTERDPAALEAALVQLGAARIQAATVGPAFVHGVIELLGAAATDRALGFDRAWRDLVALAANEPPARSAAALGRGLAGFGPDGHPSNEEDAAP